CCSSTSSTGIQYTPVDCIATFCTPFIDQPPGHLAEIRSKTSEASHRLRVAIWADRHPMLTASHINSSCFRMDDIQCLPVHFLLDRPFLFGYRSLLAHDFSWFNQG